jgi:hypothetical protein
MRAEPRDLCKLRPEIVNLDLPDALAMVLNCHAVDAEQYRRLERKHGELVEFIQAER